MDEVSKIALSPAELRLLQDAAWLLTKQRLMQKAEAQLGVLASAYMDRSRNHPSPDALVWKKHPKISKGERYEELPWLMLDYPRHFEAPAHCAIRTMLLWGRHLAIMLHVSGHAAHEAMDVWAKNGTVSGWQAGYVQSPYRFEVHDQLLYNQPVLDDQGNPFARIVKYYPVTAINNLLPALADDFDFLLKFF